MTHNVLGGTLKLTRLDSWKDKVTNEKVGPRTGQQSMEKEDCTGSVIRYDVPPPHHSKHYIGRFQNSRGDQTGSERVAEV